MGSWQNDLRQMLEITLAWLGEDFGAGRHWPRIAKLDTAEKTVRVLVPGVFDILHPGHIELFRYASLIGRAVVAVNSDESAQKLKGHPPVVDEETRRQMVSAIGYVSEAIVFDGDVGALADVIGATVVVKGGDYTEESVRVTDHIGDDVEVRILPLVGHWSTSKIVGRGR